MIEYKENNFPAIYYLELFGEYYPECTLTKLENMWQLDIVDNDGGWTKYADTTIAGVVREAYGQYFFDKENERISNESQ
jgi:hypothetical protein